MKHKKLIWHTRSTLPRHEFTHGPPGTRDPAARPTWLDLARKRLDKAVFVAYGWGFDLSDAEILERVKE